MEAHSFARSDGGLTFPRSRKLLNAFGDERLVEQLRRGNEAAFEVLYDRHHAGVLSYCRHMLGSRDEAEDALQQAFVSAHADIVTSDKPIRFKAWIYTIARNRCLSVLRARREHPSEELDQVSTAGLADEVEQRAELRQLLVDLRELPEDQRAALILSELGDLSHAEIAEVIDCEAAKVKSLVFQARSGLIERKNARETPCDEIREQLSTLRGGALRRGPLRRHLNACPGCSDFRDEVKRQRQMVAAVLPVVPTLGLKESALAAVGAGAGSAGGGLLAGGGLGAAAAAKAGIAKVAVLAIATTGTVGGAVAVQQATSDSDSRDGAAQRADDPAAGGAATAEKARAEGSLAADARRGGAAEEAARKRDGANTDGMTREQARKRGFEALTGVPNGTRAREFARGRGKGRHRGLDKQVARADSVRGLRRGHTKQRSTPQRKESPGARNDSHPQPQSQPKPKPAPKPETDPAPAIPLLPELTPGVGRGAQLEERTANREEQVEEDGL
jgi:RNA polymerase sigma factor (sigma-70 family)